MKGEKEEKNERSRGRGREKGRERKFFITPRYYKKRSNHFKVSMNRRSNSMTVVNG